MVGEGRREADGDALIEVFGPLEALAALPLVDLRPDHRRRAPPAGFRSPSEADLALRELPGRASYVLLGRSVEGRPIGGVWLGQPPGTGAPVLRVLGGHHGDEWPSAELALVLAETLADGDGEDDRITALLDRASVLVVPLVNPDGAEDGSRYNAAGVDLNRNYDLEWTGQAYGGPEPFSEPETRAVRAAALISPPVAGLSLHAGAESIGYVWNWTTEPAPESAALRSVADRYAAACTRPGFAVIQGADWYETHGDTNDWSYGRQGAFDYTVELSADKAPAAEEIDALVADHLDAMRAWLDLDLPVSGRVVDALTGDPVAATLTVGDSLPFPSDPIRGAFWHAASGDTLVIEAPGYVTLGMAAGTGLTVALSPYGLAPVDAIRVRGSDRLVLDAPDGPLTLVRPGVEPVTVDLVGGVADVGPLVPGPWTVVDADGRAWPHAVFGADDGIRLTGAARQGDEIVIDGVAFGPGSRAFALWGDVRPLVELALVDESDRELVFDATSVPPDGRVDLLVVSAGSAQAVLDLNGAAEVDDRAAVRAPEVATAVVGNASGGNGCATAPRGGAVPEGTPFAALLAALTSRARRARRRGARGAS